MEVRSIEAIVAALSSAKVEYLIVGGLAVNAYGYERLTRDVDLVIGLQPDNIIRGLRAFSFVFFIESQETASCVVGSLKWIEDLRVSVSSW